MTVLEGIVAAFVLVGSALVAWREKVWASRTAASNAAKTQKRADFELVADKLIKIMEDQQGNLDKLHQQMQDLRNNHGECEKRSAAQEEQIRQLKKQVSDLQAEVAALKQFRSRKTDLQ